MAHDDAASEWSREVACNKKEESTMDMNKTIELANDATNASIEAPKADLRLTKQTLKDLTVRTGLRAGCLKEDCPGTCH